MANSVRTQTNHDLRGVYAHPHSQLSNGRASNLLFSPKPKDHSVFQNNGNHYGQLRATSKVHPVYHNPVFHEPVDVTLNRGGSPTESNGPVRVPEPGEVSLLISTGIFAIAFLFVRKRLGLRVVAPLQR
jgi:hypothetical protein